MTSPNPPGYFQFPVLLQTIFAAMFAAVAAGIYPAMAGAQAAMAPAIERTVVPDPKRKAVYDALYARYLALGKFVG